MSVAQNNDYIDFDILEIARRCGVQIFDKPPRKGMYLARCPFCGDSKNPRHGHLYLKPSTGEYKCQRCNQGGYTIGFYASLRGIDTKSAYKELLNAAQGSLPDIVLNKSRHVVEIDDNPIAPLETRHKVYSALLEMLSLQPIHKADLVKRGLPETIIKRNGYKSFPVDPKVRWKICDILASRYDLAGVPGFFINKAGRWDLSPYPSGYLIPIRDGNGAIQGCQFRILPYDKDKHDGKYIWLSSAGKNNGTNATQWLHVSIPPGVELKDKIWLTEGGLKADIASYYMGVPFLATPGNSPIERVVQTLKGLGVNNVVLAYDADQQINQNIRKVVETLDSGITSIGMKVQSASWPTRLVNNRLIPKGIDDACVEYAKQSRSVEEYIFVTVTETRKVTKDSVEETRRYEVKGNATFMQKIFNALGLKQ
jgi:DNA primase